MSAPLPFTEYEYQALRLVAARARMDQGDIYAMRRVITRTNGFRFEEVIPWREAVDMEVSP